MNPNAAAIAAAERIRAQACARVHRLGEPDELQEDAMPKKTGSTEPYLRKLAKMDVPLPKHPPGEEPKKRGRKPRAVTVPRFGVFDDGSVSIILPKFSGTLTAEEARQFIGFLGRIGVKV